MFIGRSLGSGTFGKVRIGTHTITGEKVAIKILEKDRIKDKGDVERVTREINILKKVRHPNVIQLYEVRDSKSRQANYFQERFAYEKDIITDLWLFFLAHVGQNRS